MKSELESIVRSNCINAIFATSGPPAAHYLAAYAHKKFGIPWVADFRDILEQFTSKKAVDRWHLRRLMRIESRIVSSASEIITVSQPLADQLQSRIGRPVIVIPNGFDEELMSPAISRSFLLFTMTYTGLIWDPAHRNPRPLFQALDTLIQNGHIRKKDIRVRFVGSEPDILKFWKVGYACSDVIEILPTVPYIDSLEIQRQSCILLHFSHRNQKGIYTQKIFDYLGARRPIISIPGDNGCVDELLRRTNAGVSCPTVYSIADAVCRFYNEWVDTRTVSFEGNEDTIMNFSRKTQTSNLAVILDHIIEAGN